MTVILDSGDRREFDTGAVRDMAEGKGRCDLMPLDVLAECYIQNFPRSKSGRVIEELNLFTQTSDTRYLYNALANFLDDSDFASWSDMFLAVSKHFEDGAKKYGENNWQKGLPVSCYIDSAVRHYLKHLRGDDDEPHDKAFVWNVVCCAWTCKHKPEMNNYATQA